MSLITIGNRLLKGSRILSFTKETLWDGLLCYFSFDYGYNIPPTINTNNTKNTTIVNYIKSSVNYDGLSSENYYFVKNPNQSGTPSTTINTNTLNSKYNNSLYLDGTRYLQSTIGNNLNNILTFENTSKWSISIWVKRTTANNCSIIERQSLNTPFNGWSLTLTSTNQIAVELTNNYSTSNSIKGITSNTISHNNWNHIVWTYDGSKTFNGNKLYVNGLVTSLTMIKNGLTGSIVSSSFPVFLGFQSTTGPYANFTGYMDELGIWNRVLSLQEVTKLTSQSKYYKEI